MANTLGKHLQMHVIKKRMVFIVNFFPEGSIDNKLDRKRRQAITWCNDGPLDAYHRYMSYQSINEVIWL